jgi:uridine kinase
MPLNKIVKNILTIEKPTPVLVGIDGVDGAGKTYFAKELVKSLEDSGANVLYSSVDHFHNPSSLRKPPGKEAHLSYFEDSFNYKVLKEKLLGPMKNEKAGMIRLAHFDVTQNQEVISEPVEFGPNTILVFEGVFLHREELRDYWDYSLFLEASFETTYKRMAKRNGLPADYKDKKNERYYKGQMLYLEKCRPKTVADLVIDNNDFNKRLITDS